MMENMELELTADERALILALVNRHRVVLKNYINSNQCLKESDENIAKFYKTHQNCESVVKKLS